MLVAYLAQIGADILAGTYLDQSYEHRQYFPVPNPPDRPESVVAV